MKIKYLIIIILILIILFNSISFAKYIFKETLNVATFNTKGNYYLITYTETDDPTEKIEKVYKGENHDKDCSILRMWIIRKRLSLETIKIEDMSGDIEDLSYLFGGYSEVCVCHYLRKIDLSEFNTENVTNMTFMFYECIKLEELNISNLNTSKVQDMSYMFYNCIVLNELDLRSFDTQQVTNMESMFYRCSKLTEIKVSSKWTVANANTNNMFKYCSISSTTLYN